jgi:hypothetical protein
MDLHKLIESIKRSQSAYETIVDRRFSKDRAEWCRYALMLEDVLLKVYEQNPNLKIKYRI